MEIDIFSKMLLYFVLFRIPNEGRSPKPSNSECYTKSSEAFTAKESVTVYAAVQSIVALCSIRSLFRLKRNVGKSPQQLFTQCYTMHVKQLAFSVRTEQQNYQEINSFKRI
jgi:hypothetical protein